jgi:AcrR family transcriptional regulator
MDEAPKESRYHHGDLRAALLQAGEAELAANGRLGFTLRGTAKRAGVSHAAPAHHFRDANALLAALAARGFRRLEAAMREAQADAPPDPRAKLIAAGVGYFRFGYENPALLQLMFGPENSGDHADPELQAAGGASFDLLVATVSAFAEMVALEEPAGRTLVAAAWSVVHGFTSLRLSHKLGFRDQGNPSGEEPIAALLAAVFPPNAP